MSVETPWTPPGASPEDVESFLQLRRGLPAYANESIHDWLTGGARSSEFINWKFMLRFQQTVREDFGIQPQDLVPVPSALNFFRGLDERQRVWLVHYVLTTLYPKPNKRYQIPDRVNALQRILDDAGASWTVGEVGGSWGLVEAVPGAVADTVEAVIAADVRAGALLRSAWDLAYGVHTNASHAYYDAVRAVEVLSCPLISPKDAQATLGKDINVLSNSPERFSFAMSGSSDQGSVDQVRTMMRLLWHSHSDRHGRADYEDVSLDEARAAVLLASTLVGWLAKGYLRRKDGDT